MVFFVVIIFYFKFINDNNDNKNNNLYFYSLNGSCVKTQFTWILRQDPMVMGPALGPNGNGSCVLLDPASRPKSNGSCVRTQGQWVVCQAQSLGSYVRT